MCEISNDLTMTGFLEEYSSTRSSEPKIYYDFKLYSTSKDLDVILKMFDVLDEIDAKFTWYHSEWRILGDCDFLSIELYPSTLSDKILIQYACDDFLDKYI